MSKEASMFSAKRKQTFNAVGKKTPKPPVDAPTVLTETRAPTILTVEQANAKAAEMRNKLGEKQIDELMESGPPGAPPMMEWPESPDAGGRMFNAIMDGLRIGGAHLSAPIDQDGNRRVIWRGLPTHVILSAELCLSKFGITKSSLILSPFDGGVSIGNIEIAG